MVLSLRRFIKLVAFVAFAAGVLTGAVRIGVGRYLSSSHGKALVSEQLGSAIGMPVEVSDIDVNDNQASFRFRVMDPADPRAEVLDVKSASADVSAADIMSGRVSPSVLSFHRVALTLRVNEQGQVLTPLPVMPGPNGTFPATAIENGRVSVRQEGRPDFALSGVNLKLEPTGAIIAISGSVNDPKWGEWTARGELLRDTRTGWLELTNPNAPLDPQLLASVPFSPPGLFDDVKLTDRASVKIRLAIGANREVQPSVELRSTLAVFGMPVGPSYQLYTHGNYAYFLPTR
jgi:hypothetical protein